MEMHGADRRSARTISLSALALRVRELFEFKSKYHAQLFETVNFIDTNIFLCELQRHYKLLREELNKLPTPEGLEDLAEPLRSPSSPLEMSVTPGTPSTTPTSTLATSFTGPTSTTSTSNNSAAETSNHVSHDIDTDVEMEKMVSKVCE